MLPLYRTAVEGISLEVVERSTLHRGEHLFAIGIKRSIRVPKHLLVLQLLLELIRLLCDPHKRRLLLTFKTIFTKRILATSFVHVQIRSVNDSDVVIKGNSYAATSPFEVISAHY